MGLEIILICAIALSGLLFYLTAKNKNNFKF